MGGVVTLQAAAQQVCLGCSSTLDAGAAWCWLCHRSTAEPAIEEPAAPEVEQPRADAASTRPAVGVLRRDLSTRAALLLAAGVVAVVTPVVALLVAAPGDDSGPARPVGVLVGGEQVDERDLDRPPGP